MAWLKIKYESNNEYFDTVTKLFVGNDIYECWDKKANYEYELRCKLPFRMDYIYKENILEEYR